MLAEAPVTRISAGTRYCWKPFAASLLSTSRGPRDGIVEKSSHSPDCGRYGRNWRTLPVSAVRRTSMAWPFGWTSAAGSSRQPVSSHSMGGPGSPQEPSKGAPPSLTARTPGSPMTACMLVMATASERPATVVVTIVPSRGDVPPMSITTVPSTPSYSSRSESSARSAMLAPACTTTTASTPRKRLTIDSRVRVLRDRMPCNPMIRADRPRPDSRITRSPRCVRSARPRRGA
jgi:hypothetical protein